MRCPPTFKHIGKAIGVILVIVQIPGSSGMYPIEMMPGFFQWLHPLLPFTYGINLLREGLDLPEVSLVAILDADKEGFLRSETSLIQTIGRAARNAEGLVIMYADIVTDSMDRAITETERRRAIQMAYNKEHGIVTKNHRQGHCRQH